MCQQTKNNCTKAFDNRSRSKNLKPKKSRGVNLTPPSPSRLLRVKYDWLTPSCEVINSSKWNTLYWNYEYKLATFTHQDIFLKGNTNKLLKQRNTRHEKLDLLISLPMWQIYSKFKFAPIAKVANGTFAHRVRKGGIYHLCYTCKFGFAIHLPHRQT